MGIVLGEEDEAKLQFLTTTMVSSKMSGNSTYASWRRYFDKGEGSQSRLVLGLLCHVGYLGSCCQVGQNRVEQLCVSPDGPPRYRESWLWRRSSWDSYLSLYQGSRSMSIPICKGLGHVLHKYCLLAGLLLCGHTCRYKFSANFFLGAVWGPSAQAY